MQTFVLLIVFSALWNSLSGFILPNPADSSTLRLLHVVFRHGHRNPDDGSLISSSYADESFYPEGFGQLTNTGKRREYYIGVLLRQRYNKFLTDTWNINYLEARTTNTNRTKQSLELLLAGLYPPKGSQTWGPLPWQPIPYNYVEQAEDKETRPWSACSTKFYKLFAEIQASEENANYLKRYEELFAVLNEKTGSNSSSVFSAFNYYFGFVTQEEVGYPLDEWVYQIYPEPIKSAAVDCYYLMTNTTAIRKIMGGFLVKKILRDTASKINGTLSPSSRKVFFYSAHELNVATTLLTLNAYKLTEVPPYGAHVIFEVHEIEGVWGLKLFYQNYKAYDPIPLKISGCDYFCPFDEFSSLVEEILPESDDVCFS